MNIWFIAALAILIVVVVCLIIFILVKKQKSKTTPDITAETYKSSNQQLNKNINSLMNYINQWISSIKK